MMIYSIKLSKRKDEGEFEKFLLEEIFPAVDKRSLRNGQINELVLLKGNNTGRTNEYLWLVSGGVNGGAANNQIEKIKAFGARVTPMLDLVEIGRWSAKGNAQG